jgi:hypothetical protein
MGGAAVFDDARHVVAGADMNGPANPLSSFSLDMLARGAARLRPQQPALADAGAGAGGEAWTFADLSRMATAFGNRLRDAGLPSGARLLVVGVARTGATVAIFGAIHAGFEPVIAPPHWPMQALAGLARACAAAAIAGPTAYGALDGEHLLFETAAATRDIRIVATFGPGTSDGAFDLSPRALARMTQSDDAREAAQDARPRIGFVDPVAPSCRPKFLTQNRLVDNGFAIIEAMRAAAECPIVSLVGPTTMAGFVAGPLAAILAGLEFLQFGPVHASGLAALLERRGRVHLVAPARILPLLAEAGLCDAGALAGLVLIGADFADADLGGIGCPVLRLPAAPVDRLLRDRPLTETGGVSALAAPARR